MPFSTNYANNILSVIFGKMASLTAPSSVYIGLCSNDPEESNGSVTELSGNGYSRVLVSLKGEAFPNTFGSPSNRKIENTYQINWTKATGDWAEAKGFFLTDAQTGGNIIFYGKLAEPVTVETGMVALFDPYAFRISFPDKDVAETA